MSARRLASIALLSLVAACSTDERAAVTHRLDPYGISIDLAAGEVGGPAGPMYLFTSGGSSSTVTITPAPPGGPASARTVHDFLPGASAVVEWTRPCTFGDMTGTETRVVESFPHDRVHWIGAIDAPSGVVLLDLATDQRSVTRRERGDDAWAALRSSVRRAP